MVSAADPYGHNVGFLDHPKKYLLFTNTYKRFCLLQVITGSYAYGLPDRRTAFTVFTVQ
jgi:hypothetical protein